MKTRADFILNEALLLSPSDRERIAHRLISSLEQPEEEGIDSEYLELVEKIIDSLEKRRARQEGSNLDCD